MLLWRAGPLVSLTSPSPRPTPHPQVLPTQVPAPLETFGWEVSGQAGTYL